MWDLIVSVPYLFTLLKTEHARQKTTFSPLQVNGKVLGNRRRIIQKGMVKPSQISKPSKILSLSSLPASLMKI